MFHRLRQYDVYTKGVEGIQEKTTCGALITVISVAIVFLLFLSELGIYTTTQVVNRMHVDTVPQDAVMHIEVDITFLHEKCKDVAMDASDVKGNKDLLADSNITAVPVPSGESEGCRLTGFVDVHKVAGVVSFAHEGSLNMFSFMDFLEFNASHIVHRLSFGPDIPNMVNPLQDVHKSVEKNVALYKYGVSIVPTQYTPLYGPPIQTYQYSVTEYTSEPNEGGVMSFPGVSFMYEFSPIKVEYVESKPSFLQFVTSTSAIVGGVFAVARIVDSVIYSMSSRKLD
ncbi:hypothetical protein H310_05207 [Aphanomyces invadans]|uniref:Endoplasmic reticulum vesicle transporter C-terminal domain-containing protein n=1 Tax=Aphanomyces invadans TaxID=157072 RepID=A0A024UDA9_9STRA|nr:hypothetical protein H310_05207 [Aphanomyces invadans]ETW03857.1 hypothetical protein H310_05207 [Aphanomyces invadans]|eukprot:XP_008868086.1 hypothetical protein H310_05207 [Aphanomyces invadans]